MSSVAIVLTSELLTGIGYTRWGYEKRMYSSFCNPNGWVMVIPDVFCITYGQRVRNHGRSNGEGAIQGLLHVQGWGSVLRSSKGAQLGVRRDVDAPQPRTAHCCAAVVAQELPAIPQHHREDARCA